MHSRTLSIAVAAALALPLGAQAQDVGFPTASEYAERAAESEAMPLFRSHDVLRMTLTTDIQWLRDERNDSIEVDGQLTFVDVDGGEVTKPVEVRTRGNFRRDKRNCNFPPLRLDVPTGQMEGTVFEGQDKLKLVTPCHDGRDAYQNYIFDEYLAYRTLNLMTPYSFQVRLVEITYVDIEDDYESRTKHAFLIEDEDAMAARNRAVMVEATQFHPARAAGAQAVKIALFNYMIANSDWSPVYFHNSKLLRTEEGAYHTVPYDFDWAGVVNARYAAPDPSLGIRNVRQRLFRGFCRPELEYEPATAVFRDTQAAVEELYTSFAALGFEDFDADDAKDALKYYEDFYEIVGDPKEFEDKIVDECRDMGTG